ncbi:FKBP-type peptidyl-prolyl cis-trans isomerase [Carboxylicivirga sp. N1Y132]|uniref:Peptidyl-prolyl cis-trans isomerase n=2 Tax=Carboxylicivirga marina TaxID=2800988 RepID=A0ABS1HKU9_9BACT|nr:FKBP-type peptidyl-prolyl cis-trans isomerase [uncultured Carboxylicivirga sp.]MBK3518304.1 FKBP-type peptidyl-prolyl cis-trans isomerase [Carboxylicivirga marina]
MDFADQTDSVSYALGYLQAANLKQQFERWPVEIDSAACVGLAKTIAKQGMSKGNLEHLNGMFNEIDEAAFMKGFLNEFAYNKSYFTEMTADMYLRKVMEANKAVKDAERAEKAEANLAEGQKFLDENSKKEGIVTLESGLQYEVLKEGNGAIATASDRVKCHYQGSLIDGTVFDSSLENENPAQFAVTGVIKGWTEALQLMPEGSKWRLYIPADLAYGERGSGAKIGPNSTLIFDLDLIEVVKK